MRIRKVNRLFALAYSVLALATLGSLVAADRYAAESSEIRVRAERSLGLAEGAIQGAERRTAAARTFAGSGLERDRNAYFDAAAAGGLHDRALDALREVGLANDETDLLGAARSASERLAALERRAVESRAAGRAEQAAALLDGAPYGDAHTALEGTLEQLRVWMGARLAAEAAGAERRALMARGAAWACILLNGVLALWLALLYCRRRVLTPLIELSRRADALLLGEDSGPLGYRLEDSEIGDLAASIEAFRELELRIDRQAQTKRHAAELSLSLQQATGLQELGAVFLSRLARLLDVRQAVLHVPDRSGSVLECVAGYGLSGISLGDRTALGEGLAGQCAVDKKPIRVDDPPAGYLRIVSGTGSAAPRTLLARPILLNERLLGVVELAAFVPLDEEALELLGDLEPVLAAGLANLEHRLARGSDRSPAAAPEAPIPRTPGGLAEAVAATGDIDGCGSNHP